MNEEYYIKGLNRGDEKVFYLIFDMFHSRMCFFANQLLGGDMNSDDVVQEAFVKLWQNRTDFNHLGAVKSFLYTVVRNLSLNIIKHNKVVSDKTSFLSEEDNYSNISDLVIEAEVIDNLFTAIKKLPIGCRKVVHLGYFKKMKNKEIADYLQVSINTVKTQKKRGLHLLRSLMRNPAIWISVFLF